MNPDITVYCNGKVLVDESFREDISVVVRNGLIDSVTSSPVGGEIQKVDLKGAFLAPGFIDVQVNGGGGVLFNDSPSVEGIRTIAEAHRTFGTTGMLPTLISGDLDVVDRGLAAAEEAIEAGVPGILGIHIEGPFLNTERRGIHPAEKIRKMTRDWLDRARPLKHGKTLITVAPERTPPEWISELVRKGFIVSAGHTNATAEQVQAALAQGLSGFTHLYNAMTQLGSREPGVVGAALSHTESWCGLIADGHHVAPESMDIAFRCKGAQRLMLVTDAMPPVGSPNAEFELLGSPIRVENGVCLDANGTLAGAALDMASAVRNMASMTSASLAQACTMGSLTPATFLGLDDSLGRIAPGYQADLVILDEKLDVRAALIAGRPG